MTASLAFIRPRAPECRQGSDTRRAGALPALVIVIRQDPLVEPVRTRLRGPVLGCSDAWQLAEFYAWLLGWRVVDRSERVPGGWALVESPSGDQKLEFQREEPFVPPVWPTVAGQQQMGMHLDIAVDNLGDGPDRRSRFFELLDDAVARGAQVADHQPRQDRVVVMLDPAGHPFCLFPGSDGHPTSRP